MLSRQVVGEGVRCYEEAMMTDGRLPGLAAASQAGLTDVVKTLLDNGAQIETRDDDGQTALWLAAANGQTDVVRALISAGADVNTQRNDGASALSSASEKGYIEVVHMLLDNRADTETASTFGLTPLIIAANLGRADVVGALLSAGADVNAQNNHGLAALMFASRSGHVEVVNMLLDSGAEMEGIDMSGRTPLWVAAEKGHVKLIDLFAVLGANVDVLTYRGSSPVCAAAESGHADAVMTLMRHGANIRRREGEHRDPLSATAAWCTNDIEEILQLLISSGLCLNAGKHGPNQSALMMAAHLGRCDVVRALVKYGADVHERNFDNLQPIDVASYCGHTDIVQFLSSCNSSPVVLRSSSNLYTHSDVGVDCRCKAAVHLTTDFQTMASLLENGADVEAENVDGLRPIHCAVRTGCIELVQLLIEHRANVDAADVFGNRPLHEAVCHGLNVVQLLIQRGAKLNVQNIDGKTPLHIAVERQQSDAVVFLLSQDADVELTDIWHNTPLHYLTCELLAVSRVAESVVKVFSKHSQQFLIRNVVRQTVSIPSIAAHIISDNQRDEIQHTAAKVARFSNKHDVNLFGREKLYADCRGNTALHYAVGVYGQLKMFKGSTNVTETVEFLVKCGADINAQNDDGLTPLHVARGQKANEACLRHADEQSFTITDKGGRNFWHLLFLTRTQNEVELGTTIRPMIAIPDAAKYNVDDLNRTPLHYACMGRNPWIADSNWLAMEFIENFIDEHINKQDRFGRTALHYAAIENNRKTIYVLKAKKADDTIQDNYQRTIYEYVKIRQDFLIQVYRLRLTKSLSFITRHLRDISACIHDYFADSSPTECKAKMHETVRNLTDDCDKASYVLNTWHGCRYDYRDVTCRNPALLQENDDPGLCRQEDIAVKTSGSDSEPMNIFAAIQASVNNAMEKLAKVITEHDRRFACEVIPLGSGYEGTKIGCCNEFDYNFVLTNLSSICKVCYSPESPPGFVQFKVSTPVHDEDLKDLFDRSGILDTRTIKFMFETLAKRVLSSAKFCDVTDFEFIDPVSTNDLGLTPGNSSANLNTHIKLSFTKPVNSYHIPHAISIDLVPALRIDNWWPEDARKTELCRAGECMFVFTQPQSKYPWIGWTEPHGFISFARTESRLLRECRPVVKAAYMVVKCLSENFCQYEFFASHVIKMALFWSLDDKDLRKCSSSDCSAGVKGQELLRLVQKILRRLLCFAAQDYVPSYFLPKCHQPVWLKEKYLKQYHMRLYRHGLTYKDLFSLSEQQSHDEVLLSIKTMFTLSHVIYWSLLSDNDDLKLFVPSSINPLCDNSYDDLKE